MPSSLRARRETSPRRRADGRALVQGLVLAAVMALAGAARADDVLTCGAAPSVEAAIQRLNEIRMRGAICRAGATTTSTAAPLTWSESLAAAAKVQAAEMARMHRMGHLDSRNRGLADRLRAMGYRYSLAVENVGVGYASLEDVVDAWLASEGHCENLMNSGVLEFGLACIDAGAIDAIEERRYWTLVLGAPPPPR